MGRDHCARQPGQKRLNAAAANPLIYTAAQGTATPSYEINSTFFWDIQLSGADPTVSYAPYLGVGSPVGNKLVPQL